MTTVNSTSKAGVGWVAEVHLVTHNRVFGRAYRKGSKKQVSFVTRNCASFFLVDKGNGVEIRFPIPHDMPVRDISRRMP